MENQRESIAVIKIGEKDIEESDVAIINIFPPTKKIGLGIATRHDGEGEIWISKEECRQIIESLEKAIRKTEELEG